MLQDLVVNNIFDNTLLHTNTRTESVSMLDITGV